MSKRHVRNLRLEMPMNVDTDIPALQEVVREIEEERVHEDYDIIGHIISLQPVKRDDNNIPHVMTKLAEVRSQ